MKEQGSGRCPDDAAIATRGQSGAGSIGQKRLSASDTPNDQGIDRLREDAGRQGKEQKLQVGVFADDTTKSVVDAFGSGLQRVFGVQHGSGKVKEFSVGQVAIGASGAFPLGCVAIQRGIQQG